MFSEPIVYFYNVMYTLCSNNVFARWRILSNDIFVSSVILNVSKDDRYAKMECKK